MLVTDLARPVKRDYESIVEKVYDADVFPVIFADVDNTLRSINGQVSNLTAGQITDTISRDDLFKVWMDEFIKTVLDSCNLSNCCSALVDQ